jgi:heme oxygenase (biliverdin-IX-beta and delta-forming)
MLNADPFAVPLALSALRQATSDLHRSVERQVPLMAKDFDSFQYIAWLQVMHPFYSAVDAILWGTHHTAPISWAYVPRAPLIEQDLAWLNAGPKDIGMEVPRQLLGLESTHHRLGMLYVVEGSALGGQVLHKALARSVGVTAEHGARFLAPHGPDPRTQWVGFIDCLRPFDAEPEAIAAIVEGAQTTFAALSDWIRRAWKPATQSATVLD